MTRALIFGLGGVFLLLGGCAAPKEAIQPIDPPRIELPPPAPNIKSSQVTITNGAGKTVLTATTDAEGGLPLGTPLPPLSDLDGTLNVRVEKPDGTVYEDRVTHEPNTAVKLIFSPTHEDFVAIEQKPKLVPRRPRNFSAGIDITYALGGADTEQDFAGDRESGDDLGLEDFGPGIDARWHPGGGRAFGGLWTKAFVGAGGSQGLDLDNHPPAGEDDTTLEADAKAFVMPYIGYDVIDPIRDDNIGIRLSPYLGVRIEWTELEAVTDESGGGGIKERFSNDQVYVAPTVGVEIGIPIWRLSSERFDTELKFGVAVDYIPGLDVEGESSIGNDYDFESDAAFRIRALAGVSLRF